MKLFPICLVLIILTVGVILRINELSKIAKKKARLKGIDDLINNALKLKHEKDTL